MNLYLNSQIKLRNKFNINKKEEKEKYNMAWKDMQSWLKGGIIGAIVGIILYFVYPIIYPSIVDWFYPYSGTGSFKDMMTVFESADMYDKWYGKNYIISLVSLLIGIILGFIVGKIKSKKEDK